MEKKSFTRRSFLVRGAAIFGASALAACSPKVVEVEKVVTEVVKEVVKETVVVEGTPQIVEKVVEKVVTEPAKAGPRPRISISHIGGTSQEASERSNRMKLFRESFPDIDIENRWIGYGAYVEKMPLMVASGDIADIQFCNALNDIPLMMEAAIIAETGPLLERTGVDILACTPAEAWESTNYNNRQYALAHNTYDLNVWGIYYRKDWLDKLGLKVPETVEEYAEALVAFTNQDPDGNGKQDTWGRSPFNSLKFDDDVYHAFDAAVGHHANGFWRARADEIKLDWVDPGLKDGVAWFAEVYNTGAIEPDGITAPIEVWGTKWTGGQLGSQYTSYGSLDGTLRELQKIDPNAAIVPGPAVKGPTGARGFTGEGWPWCYVLSTKCAYPEDAVRMVNRFFEPEFVCQTICVGELGITNKGLNEKGYCDEYTPEETAEMGEAYSEKTTEVADQTYFGGIWSPVNDSLVPSVLAHMPPDMKTHFDGVLAKRYSPAALEGMKYVQEHLKLSAKKRPAPSERDYWPALQTRFLEFLSQVATGVMPLDSGWNDWLSFFEANGGPQLTEEVNEM